MLHVFRQLLILALLCAGWEVECLPLPSQTVVDLTHAMGDSAITWPSNDPFAVTKVFRDRVSEEQGGYWYESRDFSQAEHSGTHLDAPAHFSEGKWRVGIFWFCVKLKGFIFAAKASQLPNNNCSKNYPNHNLMLSFGRIHHFRWIRSQFHV